MKHLNITISGQVQGVGFRFTAMEAAYRYGVKGFAINRPDHSVYIEAEGEDPGLGQFLAWCRKGPLGAKVQQVDIAETSIQGFAGFDIRR
jgi:acylphosphatase